MDNLEVFFLVFAVSGFLAWTMSMCILFAGGARWDKWALAAPVGVVVGLLTALWVANLTPYSYGGWGDVWLAVLLTSLMTVFVAEARHEQLATRGQNPAVARRSRVGVHVAQVVLVICAIATYTYCLEPRFWGQD